MQDIFYEESAKIQNEKSAKTKYIIGKVLSIISYVIAVIWFLFILNFFDFSTGSIILNIIFSLLPLILFIGMGILLGKIKDKFYVDFDYTFITGSIRLSKVIMNVKRKNIAKFDAKEIEKIGKYDSPTYNRIRLSPGVKLNILTSNETPEENKNFYYILVAINGNKNIFVLECSETLISTILKFVNRTVIDEGLLK